MKARIKGLIFPAAALLLTAAWLLYFHNPGIRSALPKWAWLQNSLAALGQKTTDAAEADEDPDNTKNNIPVHVAHITTATLHQYIDAFGTITARPSRAGQMSGSANIASPVAGVVAKVMCQIGQTVHAGDLLLQLDDRQAKASEDQAEAALAEAQASLAELKATPRPDQLQIAQLAVDKSQGAFDFAQKSFDRQSALAARQGTSAKNIEQAAQDLASAKNDLAVAQKQLALLKASPTPEELNGQLAKVAEAGAALAAAKAQHQMMAITSPIDGTVASLDANPGESIDTTKSLVSIIALDRLMADVDIPADELPANAVGLPVLIQPAAGPTSAAATEPSAPPQAKVTFVSPQVDPRDGSVMIGIDLPPDTTLRPGLTVRVQIVAAEHKDVLAVPREAVVADENGDSVIALIDGEQATHKTVKPGLQENGLIEIVADGIKEGDTVVTSGAFGLPPATHVKVVP